MAGGVNLILTPDLSVAFSKANMLSPEGRCKTFSEKANGYVRGEGAGAVILKRLKDAERDGNRILAVIRGSAVNQDGRSNGITAPNGPAQEAAIRESMLAAGITAEALDYIEAHGTGTKLGDLIEYQALANVIGDRFTGTKCRIGSAKTNFGHLEAAAGVAGFIKVVLAMQHEYLPRHLNFEKLGRIWRKCTEASK